MDKAEESACERFKEIRTFFDMRQCDFAKEIRTTQGHVSDIENKRKGVSDRVVEILCLKYNVNEEWLRTGVGEMFLYNPEEFGEICADIGANDPKARAAIMKYHKLSPEDKRLWWKWAEKFLK